VQVRITTELLYKAALVFALMDAVCVPLLVWRVRVESFRRLKWPLAISAALVWWGIWSWAIGNYWETFYRYVFPAWLHTWIPWTALVIAGTVSAGLWALSLRLKWNPVLVFLLMGGSLGCITHAWAVYLGIVARPPMLQGASPLAVVTIAFFEFMVYWCVILTLAKTLDWARGKLARDG